MQAGRREPGITLKLGVGVAGVAGAGVVDSSMARRLRIQYPGARYARRLFWRLGRRHRGLAKGDRTPARAPRVGPGNVRYGDRRNQVRAVAAGVGRRFERSRQVIGGRGKRAKRGRMESGHRPEAAKHGSCALSMDRDDLEDGSSGRCARLSLATDLAISGLTPSPTPLVHTMA